MVSQSYHHLLLDSWTQTGSDLFSTLPLGVVILDGFGIIRYHNPAFCRQIAAPIQTNITDIFPELAENLDRVLEKGNQIVEWIKSERIMICISPISFDDEIGGAIGFLYDQLTPTKAITTLPEVKELILERDAIIDSISEGVWVCDADGVVIRVNPVSARLSGAEVSEYLGKNMAELEENGFFKDCATLEAIKSKTTVTRMVELKKTGIKVISTVKPILDNQGNLVMTVGTERDITKLESLHQFLEEQTLIQTNYHSKIKELQQLHDISQTYIAKSKSMFQVLNYAIKVSSIDSIVLIHGESGVGKSAIVELIHKHSSRMKSQLLGVNCATIPESLIESELFGYEKGAFTGAKDSGKLGLIEMANGGTLFLDEIAELSIKSQSKLLKFLDEGAIFRIGGTIKRSVDVRIITATNCDLEKLIKEGKFRQDLYYRLNVISIHIPPLRERNDCVLELLRHYMAHFTTKMNIKRVLAPKTLEMLLAYSYPGNIRELINICEKIVVLTDREYVIPSDLPRQIFIKENNPNTEQVSLTDGETLTELIERVERAALVNARKQHGSHQKMAKALGVTQPTITRKMKKYELN